MKKTVLLVCVIALCMSIFALPTAAADIPEPYFDLAFNADGTIYDAMKNTTATLLGETATVAPIEVTLDDGQVHTTWAARFLNDFDYIEFFLDEFTTADEWINFVTTHGITLETYIAIDQRPTATTATTCLIGNCYGGNMIICLRARGADFKNGATTQVNFLVGTTDAQSAIDKGGFADKGTSNYVYAGDGSLGADNVTDTEIQDDQWGKLIHFAATFDPINKTLAMYCNGIKVQSAVYGDGNFKTGNADHQLMTIGQNGSYPAESTGKHSPYTVTEGRMYACVLTDEQIFAAYTKCREDIITGALDPTKGAETEAPVTEAPVTEAPATEAPVTEAPVTEAPATEAPATEAPATEAPVTEAPTTEAPVTEAPTTEAPAKGGCGGVIGVGALVAILGTAVVLRKKEN